MNPIDIDADAADRIRAHLEDPANNPLNREDLIEILAEYDHLAGVAYTQATQLAQVAVDATTIKHMEIRGGRIELKLELARDILLAFCAAARSWLEHHGAENYTETDVTFPSYTMTVQDGQDPEESYVLTVTRRWGITPDQKRLRAEAERDAALALVEQLRQANTLAQPA